ncbi:MAG TPA: hypothetical protein VFH61_10050 [Thermoleophilia bacterium]|nr:hypothetical protein [Thermoleophilia bacterium]
MTLDDTSQLVQTLKARAKNGTHVSCADVFQIAHDLDIPLALVGRTCDELGVKIKNCQLGLF